MQRQAVVFIGHGSPMNMIEDNSWTRKWTQLGRQLPRPRAILMISAHWFTPGLFLQTAEQPDMIYDMYGFPEEIYKIVYPAQTDQTLIKQTQTRLASRSLRSDPQRGYDHGAYSVLLRMYPAADIPVVQLSVNRQATAEDQIELGRQLAALREAGVLIIGSGNVVHNLRAADYRPGVYYPWAAAFDQAVKDRLQQQDLSALGNWETLPGAAQAVPIPDHFYPLLTAAGAAGAEEQPDIFNEDLTLGSLSMTSYVWH
ncbi:MAG: 4,5-DOPA dioxygenase extradiol [Oscillospiraceae bacterium]|nr:4,5-DOPA dioxygenase extradiol [Oscillospiraceae bacterium]